MATNCRIVMCILPDSPVESKLVNSTICCSNDYSDPKICFYCAILRERLKIDNKSNSRTFEGFSQGHGLFHSTMYATIIVSAVLVIC